MMDLPLPDPVIAAAQARPLARQFRRAAWISLAFVALLAVIKFFEIVTGQPFDALALRPHELAGLIGVLTAPLLHASLDHLVSNALPLLILGTLTGGLYPRASARALPLIWIGSGVGVWFLGQPGSAHIGASGIAHGLMFLVFVLGVLRRDRQAIAAGMLAFFLYGGMLLTIFPRELGISWESHLCGAIGGVLAAIFWRRLDPPLPRKRYSWEDEPDEDEDETLGHELPPGSAEDAWMDSAADADLDWDDDPAVSAGNQPARRRGRRRLH